jgi:uncharacterized SAM-binding protein YcdF (DUF218 family)
MANRYPKNSQNPMFLFLSKLLPLFVYPLGLFCLLAIAALILIWKRPQWAAGTIALGLVIVLLTSNGWVAPWFVRSLEWRHIRESEPPNAEAIVVLGGATRAKVPPRPWVEVNESGDRPLYGAKLYLDGKAPLVILTGGRIAWLGGDAPESEDMAKFVEAMGVPESAIVQEPQALNTYQNAVYTHQILEDRNIDRVLLVTSAIHMPRSLMVFRKQGINAIPAPTDFLIAKPPSDRPTTWQSVLLNLIPEAGRLEMFTRALKEYIGIAVYWLRGWL